MTIYLLIHHILLLFQMFKHQMQQMSISRIIKFFLMMSLFSKLRTKILLRFTSIQELFVKMHKKKDTADFGKKKPP